MAPAATGLASARGAGGAPCCCAPAPGWAACLTQEAAETCSSPLKALRLAKDRILVLEALPQARGLEAAAYSQGRGPDSGACRQSRPCRRCCRILPRQTRSDRLRSQEAAIEATAEGMMKSPEMGGRISSAFGRLPVAIGSTATYRKDDCCGPNAIPARGAAKEAALRSGGRVGDCCSPKVGKQSEAIRIWPLKAEYSQSLPSLAQRPQSWAIAATSGTSHRLSTVSRSYLHGPSFPAPETAARLPTQSSSSWQGTPSCLGPALLQLVACRYFGIGRPSFYPTSPNGYDGSAACSVSRRRR